MSANADKKNMKEVVERQVVVATYYAPSSVFKVPKGKDINKAHSYWVKYNTLHIYWTKEDEDNENVEEIRPTLNATEASNYYYPQETEVELAEDYNIESSDDEPKNCDDNNKSANDNKKDMKNDIVGVECYKCKQPPFGAYKRGDWLLYLHSKCAYCGQENAVRWKWASNDDNDDGE